MKVTVTVGESSQTLYVSARLLDGPDQDREQDIEQQRVAQAFTNAYRAERGRLKTTTTEGETNG